MSYVAEFRLASIEVRYTSGEDGEYDFHLFYDGIRCQTITTPDNVPDFYSQDNPSPAVTRTKDLANDQSFWLVLESHEKDFLSNGFGRVAKPFGVNDGGLHTIQLQDDDENVVTFYVHIKIVDTTPGFSFGDQPPPKDTVSSLKGVRLYEDWKYNVESVTPVHPLLGVRAQNFTDGDYDLPYEPEFNTGGRFPMTGRVLGVRPDSLSSLQVGTDYSVELYDQPGQPEWANKVTISENTPVMPDGWNDRVKSIRVRKIPVPR